MILSSIKTASIHGEHENRKKAMELKYKLSKQNSKLTDRIINNLGPRYANPKIKRKNLNEDSDDDYD